MCGDVKKDIGEPSLNVAMLGCHDINVVRRATLYLLVIVL